MWLTWLVGVFPWWSDKGFLSCVTHLARNSFSLVRCLRSMYLCWSKLCFSLLVMSSYCRSFTSFCSRPICSSRDCWPTSDIWCCWIHRFYFNSLNIDTYIKIAFIKERERELFYLTMHSTHFIYGYMTSDIWLRTILIVRKETRCHHIGYSYRLTARVLLYAPSHRQDNTYHSLCYTSRGALAGTRNSSMGPPYEGSIRWPIAPWANALPLSYVPLLHSLKITNLNIVYISRSSQCSTTGVTKAVVCVILSVGWWTLAANR